MQVRESRECQTEEESPGLGLGLGELDLGLLDQLDPAALLGPGPGSGSAMDSLAALYAAAGHGPGAWNDCSSASVSGPLPLAGPQASSVGVGVGFGRNAAPPSLAPAVSAFGSNTDAGYEPVRVLYSCTV